MLEALKALIFDLMKFYVRLKAHDASMVSEVSQDALNALNHWMRLPEEQQEEAQAAQKAIQAKNTLIKSFVDGTMNKSKVDKVGNTPLMQAVRWNYFRIVDAIISHPSQINYQDTNNDGEMLHTLAAFNDHYLILDLLLQKGSISTRVKEQGLDALMWAASKGNIKSLEVLLKHGALINSGIGNSPRRTALIDAVIAGHEETVKFLLEKGASTHLKFEGKTALEWANQKKHTNIAHILKNPPAIQQNPVIQQPVVVQQPAVPAAPTQEEVTMHKELKVKVNAILDFCHAMPEDMHPAAISDQIQKLKTWYRLTDATQMNNSYMKDAENTFNAIIKALTDASNVHKNTVKQDAEGNTPLMLAVHNKKYLLIVRAIIDNNSDINANDKNAQGRNLLMIAAIKGDGQMLDILLTKRPLINIDDKDNERYSALMLAAHLGHTQCIETLIANGADINNSTGTPGSRLTPLILAAKAGNVEVVKLLLKKGAILETTYQGQTALTVARARNHQEVVNLLDSPASANQVGTPVVVAKAAPISSERASPNVAAPNPYEYAKKLMEVGLQLTTQLATAKQTLSTAQKSLAQEGEAVQAQQQITTTLNNQLTGKKRQLDELTNEIQNLEARLGELKEAAQKNMTEIVTLVASSKTQNTQLLQSQQRVNTLKDQVNTQEQATNQLQIQVMQNAQERNDALKPINALLNMNQNVDNQMSQGSVVRMSVTTGSSSSDADNNNNNNSNNNSNDMTDDSGNESPFKKRKIVKEAK